MFPGVPNAVKALSPLASDPESPATLTAATRAPVRSSRRAAAGTYFHAYVHALTTPPSLCASLNGNVRVMDENATEALSEHDSSRTAGAGVPALTTSASRFFGSCAPRASNSKPAPSNASASGAAPLVLTEFIPEPQHALVSERRASTASNHSRVVYRASGMATWYAPHVSALFGAG